MKALALRDAASVTAALPLMEPIFTMERSRREGAFPAVLRFETSEIDAATIVLLHKLAAAADRAADRNRLWDGVVGILAKDPDYVSEWIYDGTLHLVPGPRLLELLAPMADVREALGR